MEGGMTSKRASFTLHDLESTKGSRMLPNISRGAGVSIIPRNLPVQSPPVPLFEKRTPSKQHLSQSGQSPGDGNILGLKQLPNRLSEANQRNLLGGSKMDQSQQGQTPTDPTQTSGGLIHREGVVYPQFMRGEERQTVGSTNPNVLRNDRHWTGARAGDNTKANDNNDTAMRRNIVAGRIAGGTSNNSLVLRRKISSTGKQQITPTVDDTMSIDIPAPPPPLILPKIPLRSTANTLLAFGKSQVIGMCGRRLSSRLQVLDSETLGKRTVTIPGIVAKIKTLSQQLEDGVTPSIGASNLDSSKGMNIELRRTEIQQDHLRTLQNKIVFEILRSNASYETELNGMCRTESLYLEQYRHVLSFVAWKEYATKIARVNSLLNARRVTTLRTAWSVMSIAINDIRKRNKGGMPVGFRGSVVMSQDSRQQGHSMGLTGTVGTSQRSVSNILSDSVGSPPNPQNISAASRNLSYDKPRQLNLRGIESIDSIEPSDDVFHSGTERSEDRSDNGSHQPRRQITIPQRNVGGLQTNGMGINLQQQQQQQQQKDQDSQDFDLFGRSTSNVFSSFEDPSGPVPPPNSGSPKNIRSLSGSGLGIFGEIADIDIEGSQGSAKTNSRKESEQEKPSERARKGSHQQAHEQLNRIGGKMQSDRHSQSAEYKQVTSLSPEYSETLGEECDRIHGIFLKRKSFKAIRAVFLVKTHIYCVNSLADIFRDASLVVTAFLSFRDACRTRKTQKMSFLSGKKRTSTRQKTNYAVCGYLAPFLKKIEVFVNTKLKVEFVMKQLERLGVSLQSLPLSCERTSKDDLLDYNENIRSAPQVNTTIVEEIINTNMSLCGNDITQASIPIRFCVISGFPCASVIFGRVVVTRAMVCNPDIFEAMGIKFFQRDRDNYISVGVSGCMSGVGGGEGDGGKSQEYSEAQKVIGVITPSFLVGTNIPLLVTARNYCKSARCLCEQRGQQLVPVQPPLLMLVVAREYFEQKKISILKGFRRQRVVEDKKNYDAFETYHMCINSRCSFPDHIVAKLCDSSPTKLANSLFFIRAKKSLLVFLQAALLDRQLEAVASAMNSVNLLKQVVVPWKSLAKDKAERHRSPKLPMDRRGEMGYVGDSGNYDSFTNYNRNNSNLVLDESSPQMTIFRRRDAARSRLNNVTSVNERTSTGQIYSNENSSVQVQTDRVIELGESISEVNISVSRQSNVYTTGIHSTGKPQSPDRGDYNRKEERARDSRLQLQRETLAENFNRFRLLSLGLEGLQNAIHNNFSLNKRKVPSIDFVFAPTRQAMGNSMISSGLINEVERGGLENLGGIDVKTQRQRSGLILYNPKYIPK